MKTKISENISTSPIPPIICMTVDQINAILAERRIIEFRQVTADRMIVACEDNLLRSITFNKDQIEWLDSYDIVA